MVDICHHDEYINLIYQQYEDHPTDYIIEKCVMQITAEPEKLYQEVIDQTTDYWNELTYNTWNKNPYIKFSWLASHLITPIQKKKYGI